MKTFHLLHLCLLFHFFLFIRAMDLFDILLWVLFRMFFRLLVYWLLVYFLEWLRFDIEFILTIDRVWSHWGSSTYLFSILIDHFNLRRVLHAECSVRFLGRIVELLIINMWCLSIIHWLGSKWFFRVVPFDLIIFDGRWFMTLYPRACIR